MSLLTDDEIYGMYSEPSSDAEMIEFARAVEAAILAKLTSAELPEPMFWMHQSTFSMEKHRKDKLPCHVLSEFEDKRDYVPLCAADQLRQAFAQGAASQLAQEPTALMYQHDETGRVGFLEAWGPVDLFQKANPRLRIVASLYTRKEASK
jgi:hypothetical protein